MLFNSFVFLVFYAVVLAAYLGLKRRHLQNAFLTLCSLFFYAYGEPYLVVLILGCTLTGFLCALGMERWPQHKKALMALATVVCMGTLFVFKYYDFFLESFLAAFRAIGLPFQVATLSLALPIGISFFTFQTIGYVIDVYRGGCHAERSPVDFFLFITFFPQLVAGPVERATHLLPQLKEDREVTPADATYGGYLVLQGLVKKVVVADNLAPVVDLLFRHENLSSPLIAVGLIAFAFQIYCDFSGYTDIARGVARTFGFRLLLNFRHPYVARSPTEFWHRWHITLSTWFKDYVYITLGGNRRGRWRGDLNIFLTMLVSGLWHGASWNFLAWGAFHGLIVVLHKRWAKLTSGWRLKDTAVYRTFSLGATFTLVLYGWLLFRITDMGRVVSYSLSLATTWTHGGLAWLLLLQVAPYVGIALVVDALERRALHVEASELKPGAVRWMAPISALFLLLLLLLGSVSGGDFIYFKF